MRVRVRVCAWTPGIGLGLGQHLKLSTIPAKHLSRTHTRTYTPLHVLSRSDAHTHTPVRCIPYTLFVRLAVCLSVCPCVRLSHTHTWTYCDILRNVLCKVTFLYSLTRLLLHLFVCSQPASTLQAASYRWMCIYKLKALGSTSSSISILYNLIFFLLPYTLFNLTYP